MVPAEAPSPQRVRSGDAIIVSGPIGEHGIAVLSVREGIAFETALRSDVAPVAASVLALFAADIDVHCLRDPTRGGLATALAEIVAARGLGMLLDEAAVPIRPEVEDACELLGLDPLYVACEGRFIAIVAPQDAPRAIDLIDRTTGGGAAIIGHVREQPALVVLRSRAQRERVLDILSGEQLPRIC